MKNLFSFAEKAFAKKALIVIMLLAFFEIIYLFLEGMEQWMTMLCIFAGVIVFCFYLWAEKRICTLYKRKDKLSKWSIIFDLLAWAVCIAFWIAVVIICFKGMCWIVYTAVY